MDELYNVSQEQQLAQYFYEQAEKETRGVTRSNFQYTKDQEKEFRNIPIRTLITDPYFLGLEGYIYPAHLDDIEELWEERKKRPINLALFEHSIGAGKTMLASVIIWLQWYEISTLVSPQTFFNLTPNSTIAIMTLSRTEVQSRRVIFSEVWKRFQSGFNKDYFPPNPRYSKEISISQNNTVIYAGTSSELSILGYNLYCVSQDSKIKTPNGIITLKDVISKGKLGIWGFDINKGFIKTEALDVIDNGEKEVFEVVFNDDSIIRCTQDHQFLVYDIKNGYQYKKLEEVNEKEIITSHNNLLMRIMYIKSLGRQKVCDVIGSKTSNFVLDNGVVVHNCGVIDEANFLEVVEGSKRSEAEVYDAAENIYNATYNRMVSRFMMAGKVPGFIVMISSRKSRNSFMERKIIEGIKKHNDPSNGIFFKVRSLWQAKPKEYFPSNQFFYIDTDSLKKINPLRGESLYQLQKKFIQDKIEISGPEPEMVGLF